MTERKSLKIRRKTYERFARFKREYENQSGALARLLDEAGVQRRLECADCGTTVQAHARDEHDRILCFDCAGVDPDAVRPS